MAIEGEVGRFMGIFKGLFKGKVVYINGFLVVSYGEEFIFSDFDLIEERCIDVTFKQFCEAEPLSSYRRGAVTYHTLAFPNVIHDISRFESEFGVTLSDLRHMAKIYSGCKFIGLTFRFDDAIRTLFDIYGDPKNAFKELTFTEFFDKFEL